MPDDIKNILEHMDWPAPDPSMEAHVLASIGAFEARAGTGPRLFRPALRLMLACALLVSLVAGMLAGPALMTAGQAPTPALAQPAYNWPGAGIGLVALLAS